MATQQSNPFILPGFGQTGDAAQNPLVASMQMMRDAWEGMSKAGGLDSALMAGTSPEDLERRIADLRAVEHWLKMNLSMLASTIQALEVQRATMDTLKNFFDSAASGLDSADLPSFGNFKPAAEAAASAASAAGLNIPGSLPSGDASGLFGEPLRPVAKDPSENKPATPIEAVASTAEEAMQGWWDMLQSQFDNLAEATAATLKGAEDLQESAIQAQQKVAENLQESAKQAQQKVAENVAKVSKATKTTATTATQASPLKTTPAKKAATKKSVAKKASAKKAAPKKASKKSVKKAVAKKATAKKAANKSAK